MAFDYIRARATAVRLIDNFGGPASLIQYVNSGTEYAPTRTEQAPIAIVVVDLEQELMDGSGNLTGKSMRQLLISTSAGVTPAKADVIEIKGLRHLIDKVEILAPAAPEVLYTVTLEA